MVEEDEVPSLMSTVIESPPSMTEEEEFLMYMRVVKAEETSVTFPVSWIERE